MINEKILLEGSREVYRLDGKVERTAKPWSLSVLSFLRHLEKDGLPVEQVISVDEEVEISVFAEGEMVHPKGWSDDALYEVGKLLARLHDSAQNFVMKDDAIWQDWCLRQLGGKERICCHGDIAPWNVITENGYPKVLLDWEYAGPLDPFVELARVCWLFPQLVDDDLQAFHDLPSLKKRAEQVRIITEGYGLSTNKRNKLVDQIIEVIICETAVEEAIKPAVTFDSMGNLWGFAWRSRSLYWVWRNRDILQAALN